MKRHDSSGVLREAGHMATGAAGHQGLLDAKVAESGIGTAAGACQVDAATSIASPTVWVVIRKSIYLASVLLRLRLCLLGLKAKVCVLALQCHDALAHEGQMLTQHRRRCVLVEKRLQFFEQGLKHYVYFHLFGRGQLEGGAS